jgi:hypothetical protein
MYTVVLTLFDNALSFYLARVLRSGYDIRPGLPGLVWSPVTRAGPFALMHLLLLLLLLLLLTMCGSFASFGGSPNRLAPAVILSGDRDWLQKMGTAFIPSRGCCGDRKCRWTNLSVEWIECTFFMCINVLLYLVWYHVVILAQIIKGLGIPERVSLIKV